MSHKIVFYHNPQSRAAIVHWMLEEVGAEYEIRHIDFQKGDQKAPGFLALNPMGKIPTILVDGSVITEAPLWLLVFPLMFVRSRHGGRCAPPHGHADYRRPDRSPGW